MVPGVARVTLIVGVGEWARLQGWLCTLSGNYGGGGASGRSNDRRKMKYLAAEAKTIHLRNYTYIYWIGSRGIWWDIETCIISPCAGSNKWTKHHLNSVCLIYDTLWNIPRDPDMCTLYNKGSHNNIIWAYYNICYYPSHTLGPTFGLITNFTCETFRTTDI